jgi:hypothetical protein
MEIAATIIAVCAVCIAIGVLIIAHFIQRITQELVTLNSKMPSHTMTGESEEQQKQRR